MDLFKIVNASTTEFELQKKITSANVEEYTTEMFFIEGNERQSTIGCFGGEFILQRNLIKGDLRFSLIDCPNALTWTITTGYPPERNKIVIHSTINRERKNDEFVEEWKEFVDEWANGLLKHYS